MTNKISNHEFDDIVNAVRNDVPTAEQLQLSAAHVAQSLRRDAVPVAAPEVIRGCDDIAQLLPSYSAGQLPLGRAMVIEAHLRECSGCRARATGRTFASERKWTPAVPTKAAAGWPRFALLSAVFAIAVAGFVVHNMYFAVPAGARASVQSIDGNVYRVTSNGDVLARVGDALQEGDNLRTTEGAHAYVRLSDGSVVEVNERTSFTVQARGKDMTVAVDRGAVLVQAARRNSGHLYVKTPDCRVAVTGTVFSVNSGMKGSRVSVMEGTVDVRYGGSEDVLHAGDQVSTSSNMDSIAVEDDIAWSRDRQKHLELMAELSKLQRRLEQVALPAPRYNSELLDKMPAGAIVYVSVPNAGQALEEANQILQSQIQQSPALKDWFSQSGPNSQYKINEFITKLRQLSDYLGDEVVLVGLNSSKSSQVALVAQIRRSGLREFLQTQFIDGEHKLAVVDPGGLASLPLKSNQPLALIRESEVVFAGDRATLESINNQLNSSGAGLTGTEFGKRIQDAYSRGAGILFAADMHALMQNPRRGRSRPRDTGELERTGIADIRYFIAEHRELNGAQDNRMLLDFSGQRRGIASWLAAPAPMGSLDFVSQNAAAAVAFIAKDPQAIMDDVLSFGRDPERTNREIADAESKLHLRIREDIAANLGGDTTIALDGAVLPTPAWKLIVEVHNAGALAASLEKLVQAVNEEAQRKGKPGVTLQSEDVSGQKFYALVSQEKVANPVTYTFSSGYMIVGPSRAVVMNALHTKAMGNSLARSGDFKSMLPKDANANYSAVAYQNLSPVLQPLLSRMTGEQAAVLQQLAADSRPSVIAAWGRDNRIDAASNSRFVGFDWLALGTLLGEGTSQPRTP
jgi:hypothetical protein